MNIIKLRFGSWGFTIVFLMMVFALPFVVSADFDPTQWTFRKEIIPPANLIRDSFIELSFDSEIVANARLDFADLRIIRNDGLEISYLNQLDLPARLINQDYLGNEATIVTFDLERSDIQHFGLTLTTGGHSPQREMQIEGSGDNQTWAKFESAVEGNTVNYPATASRYLRVTIYDRGEKRLIIAGALAHRSAAFFFYESARVYRLYFGRPDAERPEYNLTSFQSVNTRNRPVATLGPIENNPRYILPPPPPTPLFDRHPYFLLGAIVLITIGIVGGFAFRLFKQTRV